MILIKASGRYKISDFGCENRVRKIGAQTLAIPQKLGRVLPRSYLFPEEIVVNTTAILKFSIVGLAVYKGVRMDWT